MLNTQRIGPEDDFLAFGGNSMQAGLIAFRVQKALNCSVSIDDIFNHPTARDLSAFLAPKAASVPPAATTIAYTPLPERLPLASAQRRMMALDQVCACREAPQAPSSGFGTDWFPKC